MSSDAVSGYKVGGIIGLVFILPMFFILVLFQFLGIGAIVFPILIPMFLGIGLIIFLVFAVIMVVVKSASKRTVQMNQAFVRSYEAEIASGSDYMAEYPPGASYEIPVYCPYCQESIELNTVHWIDSSSLICSNCNNQVRVEVSEE